MFTTDLRFLMETLENYFPGVMIDKITCNGVIHTTCYHQINLSKFMSILNYEEQIEYLREVLEG
jgi:hypothetical protein